MSEAKNFLAQEARVDEVEKSISCKKEGKGKGREGGEEKREKGRENV